MVYTFLKATKAKLVLLSISLAVSRRLPNFFVLFQSSDDLDMVENSVFDLLTIKFQFMRTRAIMS